MPESGQETHESNHGRLFLPILPELAFITFGDNTVVRLMSGLYLGAFAPFWSNVSPFPTQALCRASISHQKSPTTNNSIHQFLSTPLLKYPLRSTMSFSEHKGTWSTCFRIQTEASITAFSIIFSHSIYRYHQNDLSSLQKTRINAF